MNIFSIYDKYADMLYRIALSHLQRDHDAQDAVHDVFEKYLKSPKKFRDENHERAWFIRVTINRCLDILRHHKVRDYIPLEEITEMGVAKTKEEISVMEHLRMIPEKHRSVIVLHCLEGFTVEETAAILKISVSAVKMRLQRGREHLKMRLEKEGYDV